jgi:transcription initiation factor TFIID subunit 12
VKVARGYLSHIQSKYRKTYHYVTINAMNNPGQTGQSQGQSQQQGGQTQQNQQRRPGPPLYKPEQMRSLPDAFASDKEKWETGLRSLWSSIQGNAPETPQHQDAKRRLYEFSKMLTTKMHAWKISQQQVAGGTRPSSQGQASQPQEERGSTQPTAEQQQQQQQRQKPQISAKVMEHVNTFPYVPPSKFAAGSTEYSEWIQDMKSKYLKGLVTMEQATARLTNLDGMLLKRTQEGKTFSPEEEKRFKEEKDKWSKTHSEAKTYVDNFRTSQRNANSAANTSQQGITSQQQPAGGNTGAAGNSQGTPTPARPQVNPQQAPNPALQNTQTINAAIEAAKNQQFNGPRPSIPQNNSTNRTPQMPSQNISSQQPNQQQPTIKTEAGISNNPPPLNTTSAINQMQRPMQNSPTTAHPRSAGPPMSATSQVPPQQPQALSHSAALAQASRSYSSGNTQQIHVMGHSHPSSTQRESQNGATQKMPIPKHLPERAIAPPQPVPISQARPTYSGGPSNMGNGVISQPVLPKAPGYNMAAEGDRVLSRKKLDELVKQVTGGGHGDGPSLTPEVEEVCFLWACTFIGSLFSCHLNTQQLTLSVNAHRCRHLC